MDISKCRSSKKMKPEVLQSLMTRSQYALVVAEYLGLVSNMFISVKGGTHLQVLIHCDMEP